MSQVWWTICALGHVTFYREWLQNYRLANHDLILGKDVSMTVTGIGDVRIMRLVEDE